MAYGLKRYQAWMLGSLSCLALLGLEGVGITQDAAKQEAPKVKPQVIDRRDLILNMKMKVPFLVFKGQLAICTPLRFAGLVSREVKERFYLWMGLQALEMEELAQLQGYVCIRCASEALAFVRLRTSPRTYHLFPPHAGQPQEVEVLLDKEVTAGLLFGDEEEAGSLRKPPWIGYGGIIDAGTAKRLGFQRAYCGRVGKGFQVERTLMTEDAKTGQVRLSRVTEWVGRDGQYILQKRSQVDLSKVPSIWWALPKG